MSTRIKTSSRDRGTWGAGTFTDPLSDAELKRRIRRKYDHEKRQHGGDPIKAFNALMSSLRVQLTYRKNQAGAAAAAVKRRIRKIMALAQSMYGMRVARARTDKTRFDRVLRGTPRSEDTIASILRRKR